MASEDVVGRSAGESAVTAVVNLAEEAKLAGEVFKAPGYAILSICKPLVAGDVAAGVNFEVDYGSKEHAAIVYASLNVDKELQPDKVKRQMSICEGRLLVHFEAVEARFLRASFSAFVDLMILATQTIEEFGQNQQES